MRKKLIWAAAVMMAVSLTACGQNTDRAADTENTAVAESSTAADTASDAWQATSVTEDSPADQSADDLADPDAAERADESADGQSGDTVSYTYQLSSERVYDYVYSDADSDRLLIKSEYDLLSLEEADDDSGNAGTVNIILDEINKNTKDQSEKFVSDNKSDAEQALSERDSEYTGNYENDNDLTIERADNRVLSVVRDNYEFLMGAHGYDATSAYSYDAMTGERLKLTDVLTSTDNIAKILSDELIKNNPAERFDLTSTDELEDTIQKLLDGDEYYTGDNDTHYVIWYVGRGGINFVFNQYDIASYAAGKFYVTLSEKDYPDLVNSYYADSPADYITKIGLYDTNDVGGEDLTVEPTYDEYNTVTDVSITFGDKSQKLTDLGADGISGYLVHAGGRNYLYLNVNMASDWEQLFIVDLNSNDLKVLDFDEGVYDSTLIDPNDMILQTRTNVMSTVQIERSYRVGTDGVPEANENMYRVTTKGALWLTLKQDAEFDVLDDQDSDSTHKVEFARGTQFRLWRTDNDSIMDCVTEDSDYVRFKVDTSSYPQKINDEYDLEDLFDGTVFAG